MRRVPKVWRNWWAVTLTGRPASSRRSIAFCQLLSRSRSVSTASGSAASGFARSLGKSHGEAIEVVRPLELAHHELGDEPGQGFGPPGKVLLVEGCANR